jgi:hypothetical protein
MSFADTRATGCRTLELIYYNYNISYFLIIIIHTTKNVLIVKGSDHDI